jgi:hypothetical protein
MVPTLNRNGAKFAESRGSLISHHHKVNENRLVVWYLRRCFSEAMALQVICEASLP